MHACINTYVHTYIHTYMHTYMHTYTHTSIHTYNTFFFHTYIYTYIHTFRRITLFYFCTTGDEGDSFFFYFCTKGDEGDSFFFFTSVLQETRAIQSATERWARYLSEEPTREAVSAAYKATFGDVGDLATEIAKESAEHKAIAEAAEAAELAKVCMY